ncbi:MAG: hypothetical protein E7382_04995 [Clostridiales bacterium]|nr:hypothetical protein [Clostridiales bacterium]
MILFLGVIIFSMITIAVVVEVFIAGNYGLSTTYVILSVVFCTIFEIILDSILALAVRRLLPEKWFSADKTFYTAKKRECLIYDFFKIKKWKDKVPDLGALSGFRKNKIANPNDLKYVERYILEANFGVVVHLACMFLGGLVVFIFPLKIWWFIGLPVAIVNFVLNFLTLAVLRYNLKKLHVLRKFNLKKAKNFKV